MELCIKVAHHFVEIVQVLEENTVCLDEIYIHTWIS